MEALWRQYFRYDNRSEVDGRNLLITISGDQTVGNERWKAIVGSVQEDAKATLVHDEKTKQIILTEKRLKYFCMETFNEFKH